MNGNNPHARRNPRSVSKIIWWSWHSHWIYFLSKNAKIVRVLEAHYKKQISDFVAYLTVTDSLNVTEVEEWKDWLIRANFVSIHKHLKIVKRRFWVYRTLGIKKKSTVDLNIYNKMRSVGWMQEQQWLKSMKKLKNQQFSKFKKYNCSLGKPR